MNENKETTFSARITTEDLKKLKKHCKAANTTVSEWVREKIKHIRIKKQRTK